MTTFDGRTYFPCHITTPKQYGIDKVHFFRYNCQTLNPISEKYVWEMVDYFIQL